jgi:hypothetical protein
MNAEGRPLRQRQDHRRKRVIRAAIGAPRGSTN